METYKQASSILADIEAYESILKRIDDVELAEGQTLVHIRGNPLYIPTEKLEFLINDIRNEYVIKLSKAKDKFANI